MSSEQMVINILIVAFIVMFISFAYFLNQYRNLKSEIKRIDEQTTINVKRTARVHLAEYRDYLEKLLTETKSSRDCDNIVNELIVVSESLNNFKNDEVIIIWSERVNNNN